MKMTMNQVNPNNKPTVEQEEDIVSLLESNIWETTIKLLFKQNLLDAKKVLLTNVGLPTDTRTGYIMYRQKTMDAFASLYRRHNIILPEWLED
jgi:hypothetical protein